MPKKASSDPKAENKAATTKKSPAPKGKKSSAPKAQKDAETTGGYTTAEMLEGMRAFLPEGTSKTLALSIYQGFMDLFARALKERGSLRIHKFGSFVVKELPSRQGFNPKSKQKIQIKARKALRFKASRAFFDAD